jgi:hypothetical protein
LRQTERQFETDEKQKRPWPKAEEKLGLNLLCGSQVLPPFPPNLIIIQNTTTLPTTCIIPINR